MKGMGAKHAGYKRKIGYWRFIVSNELINQYQILSFNIPLYFTSITTYITTSGF